MEERREVKTPAQVERAIVLSARARKMVPEIEKYPKGGSHERGDLLAHYSLAKLQAPGGSMQELVGKLKDGAVATQAKELLEVLHRQYDVAPEVAVRLLVALSIETQGIILRYEENTDKYLALARAIQETASLPDIVGSAYTQASAVLPEVTPGQFLQMIREGHAFMQGTKQRHEEALAKVPETDAFERGRIQIWLGEIDGIIAQFKEILDRYEQQ